MKITNDDDLKCIKNTFNSQYWKLELNFDMEIWGRIKTLKESVLIFPPITISVYVCIIIKVGIEH